jgi:Zn-dependent protease with chaperone function
MDFFEAQAVAKKRTSRLVLLFVLAVFGTIIAAYAAGVLILGQSQHYTSDQAEISYSTRSPPLWQPKLFTGVAFATLTVVGLASLFKWRQFSAGGSVVARNLGGREVDSRTTDFQERRLLNVVEEMAIASGTPVPAVFILDDEPGINAFAAGLTTSDAVVAVTRGTLEKLNRDELQGVIGHEFSHILNGDMRLNMRLTSLLFGILILGIIGRGIIWSLRFRGARRSRNEKGNGGGIALVIAAGIALLIIGYVGYFFGRLIQAAVSRQREFLADASAVQFTRNPTGIAGALKKIGGYALGSSMNSTKSAEIGHFFFAQGFRSRFGGLWATHPPLPERIRAIDASFNGTFFSPPEVIDVSEQSFASAGLAPPRPSAPPPLSSQIPPILPAASARLAPATVGTLSADQIADAHDLLESIPARLREAAHDPAEAPLLLFALLLDANPAIRSKQRRVIGSRPSSTASALATLDELEPFLQHLPAAQRLPLVQVSLPALRPLSSSAVDDFTTTLHALADADEQVSTFEFALQKLVTHTLKVGRKPSDAMVQYHSFHAVTAEIATVLSALARAATVDPAFTAEAFAAGATQLKLIESQLRYVDARETQLASLNAALDKLAAASFPIRQRTIIAAAHVVSADGQVRITEAELLRAVSAALDCPMPPLRANAGIAA